MVVVDGSNKCRRVPITIDFSGDKMVAVSGNIHEPEVKTVTLPVLEDTLGIFGTKPPASN